MSDNLINMCCISFFCTHAGWGKRLPLFCLPGSQEVIAVGQWGTLISWKGERSKTYPFLIKACWRIARRKANGDQTGAWWQEANFDVPFLSLRCFSFKPKSGWAAWENGLLPTFLVRELTGHLRSSWNLDGCRSWMKCFLKYKSCTYVLWALLLVAMNSLLIALWMCFSSCYVR